MKKLLLSSTLCCMVFAVFAQTPVAELNFYAKQAQGDDKKLLLSLSDNISVWMDRNSTLPYAEDALFLQADILTRANQQPQAALALMRYMYEFPAGKKIADIKNILPAASQTLEKTKREDYLKVSHAQAQGDTAAQHMDDYLTKATALNLKNSYATLVKDYSKFFSRFPVYENADKMELMLGDLHRQNNNFHAAVMQYKKVYDIYSSTKYKAASLRMVGDIYAGELKDYATAMDYYQRVLREFPNTVERAATYHHMALLADSQKNYDEAVSNATQAAAVYLENNQKTDAYEVLRFKADSQENQQKNFTAAIDTLKETAKIFAKDEARFIDTNFEIARINGKKLKDPYGEIGAYQDIILAYPSNIRTPEAMFKAGNISEDLGEQAKAKQVYLRLVVEHPADSLATKAQRRINALEKSGF